jgi:hypothetical protein
LQGCGASVGSAALVPICTLVLLLTCVIVHVGGQLGGQGVAHGLAMHGLHIWLACMEEFESVCS